MTFWDKLEKYPPILLRLMAKADDGRAPTDDRIASAGGLSIAEVKHLSWSTSWENVPLYQVRGFCLGLGVDLEDRNTVRNLNRYFKNPKFLHLRRSPAWPEYKLMLAYYLEHAKT